MSPLPHPALAAFEVYSFTGALQVLDAVEKAAEVTVLAFELNDNYGLYFLVGGDTASVQSAREAAGSFARENRLEVQASADFSRPSLQLTPLIDAPDEPNDLLDQNLFTCLIHKPTMANQPNLALGFITIVVEGDVAAVKAAIDSATEAARELGKVIAANVIARPSEGVHKVLTTLENDH